MFNKQTVQAAIIATALAAGTFFQPAFAGQPDEQAANVATQHAWVDYWHAFLATLDRKLWAQGS